MEIPKISYTQVISSLISLLILSSFIILPASVSGVGSDTSTKLDDYGDLLQYEWPQIHADAGFTRYSEGPAPDTPEKLWKTTIEGIESYVAAFNGKVFVCTRTNVFALDKDTGAIVWNTTLPERQRWPAVYKIDETHLIIANYCLETESGNILWTSEEFSAKASNWAEAVYSSEEKMFYTHGESTIEGWNFSDVTKPPILEWETYISGNTGSGSGIQYGDGRIFPGSFEPHQVALNATTGEVLWDTETTGAMCFSGSYYEGTLLKAAEQDNTFYCFNAETGDILWEYNPGTQLGYWVSGSAVAYDMVYEANKDGHLYALNVTTGEMVWKYKGADYLYWPGWPVIADGKIYATMNQRVAIHPYTLEYGESSFVCLDAYTGDLIWELPIEAYAPRESTAIAYGNLYLIPGYIEEFTMDKYITLNEVWAIGSNPWSTWRNDPENNGAGQAGPTNLNVRWKFTTGGGVVSTPNIVNGRVYVGSQDKNIYCLDARDGRLLWNYATNARIKSSTAVANGKVYLGPDDGYIYCLDAINGSIIWKKFAGGYIEAHFKAVTQIRSSPIIVDGKVYVGSLDTNLYCLDADNGDIEWTYKTEGPITSSPAISDGAVYITSQEPSSGMLYKLDATNGDFIWKLDLPYVYSADRGIDLHVSPTIADGMVFAATNKDYYYAVNATTGEVEWTFFTARGTEDAGGYLVGSMAYHEGKLFIVDMFFITALNSTNGEILWKSWQGTELYTSPTYADGKVYVATDRRLIYVLNATDGKRLSYFEPGSNCWSSPTVYEGRLYIGNNDWNVYCFSNYSVTQGQISATLTKNEIEKGEAITGYGQIDPGISSVPVTVVFTRPDGTVDKTESRTYEDGSFTFSYIPQDVGDWTVSIRCSGASYIMQSVELLVKVVEKQEQPSSSEGTQLEQEQQTNEPSSGIPIEHIIAIVLTLIVLVAVTAYLFINRRNKSSPVVISD